MRRIVSLRFHNEDGEAVPGVNVAVIYPTTENRKWTILEPENGGWIKDVILDDDDEFIDIEVRRYSKEEGVRREQELNKLAWPELLQGLDLTDFPALATRVASLAGHGISNSNNLWNALEVLDIILGYKVPLDTLEERIRERLVELDVYSEGEE